MDPLDLSQKTILITGDNTGYFAADGGCRLYPMD